MAGITITITDNSETVLGEMETAVERALLACGQEAQKYARELLTSQGAVDTGNLRASVAYALSGEGATPSSYRADDGSKGGSYSGTAPAGTDTSKSVYLGTNVEYAQKIEFGQGSMAARPYIEPAIADYASKYKTIIQTELGG